MSDPVTNAEVEDVLSSIRRLVSQERRAPGTTRSGKPAGDKLVLTPSLRVSNDAPLVDAYKKQKQVQEPVEWTTQAEEPVSPEPFRGRDHLEPETMARPAPAEDVANDRFGDAQRIEDDLFEEDAFDAAPMVDVDDDIHDEGAFDLTAEDDDHASLTSDDTVETDRPANTVAPTPPRRDILSLGASELVEDEAPSTVIPSDRLSAKIAALESAIRRIPENYEPDEPGEDDYSGSDAPAMAWEDDVELDATGAPLTARTDGPSDAAIEAALASANRKDMFDDEDTFEDDDEDDAPSGLSFGSEEYFDEEMLRDLVSEIVRSELQGTLGERITRNVRKLVRREIHRALTAQELE